MSTTQVLTRDAYGVTYADPTNPDFSVRFKTTRSAKGLNGVNVDNYLTEVIVNDSNEITIGSTTANDLLSVRVRVSGSIESHDRVKEILTSIASQLDTWGSENVYLGFEPGTAPINPPAA